MSETDSGKKNEENSIERKLIQLERENRKLNREIAHLKNAIAQEKTAYTTVLNQQKASTFIQRERERYLALLLANSPSIILFLGQTQRVEFCTEYFIAKAGFQGSEGVLGHTLTEVLSPFLDSASQAKLLEQSDNVIQTNAPISFDMTFHFHQDSAAEDFAGLLVPMKDEQQKSNGIMLLFHDITDLKRSREEALSASKAKSDFLSNMSHEIRTPMNAIIGMTSIGKSAVDIERKDYCFTRIEGASHHLLGVINDILDMSKIEANKFELSPIEYDFESMLRRVVNVINFRLDEKLQKFTIHIDSAIPKTIIGDDQRLAQVITNLVGNAIKFTPNNGSISLAARLLREESDVCTIQIEVADTGIGISPEQQAGLFKSFQQAESSTTRKFGGTGLGLAISKRIIEMMGGEIWIESELGKGSTFAFIIQARRGIRKSANAYPQVHWSDLRILAVDDDPDVLTHFQGILRGLGARCDTATSGDDALALVERSGGYHIYFVDWKMPGMDGLQLTRALKTKKADVSSVVVIFSSAEWNEIEGNAKEAGVDKFLSKPLFPSAIADVISEIVGVKRQQVVSGQEDTTVNFAGSRVLLAEDVEINREIVLALLEPTHLQIDCAENGTEAVRLFMEAPQRYNMIFMDVQMPEMDGYEATRRIRSLDISNAGTIPIIAMTANVFKEDVERCLEAGMNDHVGKPLNFDDVLEILNQYLSGK